MNVKVTQEQLIGRRPRKSYYDGRPKCCPDALWPSQAKTAAVVAATGCPPSFFWSHGDKVSKTSCPAPRRPRYRRDMRSPTPTDTSYTARARTPDHERIRTRTTHAFRGRIAAAGERTRSLPQPRPHEPTITNGQRETTAEDPPVYGGPDARSLGPRAGS